MLDALFLFWDGQDEIMNLWGLAFVAIDSLPTTIEHSSLKLDTLPKKNFSRKAHFFISRSQVIDIWNKRQWTQNEWAKNWLENIMKVLIISLQYGTKILQTTDGLSGLRYAYQLIG